MRCYICDCIIPDDQVKTNIHDGKIEPCLKCMKEIHDCKSPEPIEVVEGEIPIIENDFDEDPEGYYDYNNGLDSASTLS